jgi:hypothetical protein
VRVVSTIGGVRRAFAVFGIAVVSSAVLGAIAGLIWGVVAPRVQLQIYATGAAYQVNAEASGYIAADGWFCLITAVCGLITGIGGYFLLVRRDGWPAALGLVGGAIGAAYIAMWIGGLIGLSTFNHQLATAPVGTYFNDSLSLGAKSALVCWLLLTAASIGIAQSGSKATPAENGTQVSGMWTPPAGDQPRSVE